MANSKSYQSEHYKTVRKWLAIVLCGAWIFFWYAILDEQRLREIRQANECINSTGIKATVCTGFSYLIAPEDNAKMNFVVGLIFAIIFCPLMFVPAVYISRRYIAFAEAQENHRSVRQNELRRKIQQQESEQRIARSESEAADAFRQISRSEIILKLGAIHDLVDLLEAETSEERRINIRLGVAQSLRELAAKYDVAALGALIVSDESVLHTSRAVVRRLVASPFGTIVELEFLRLAMPE
jgi:cell division protein FtsL